jgi:hypothetical protein
MQVARRASNDRCGVCCFYNSIQSQGGQAVNHIGGSNKMVSDTPRTDAAWKPDGGDYFIVDVDLARQLERELNAANERIKELEAKVDELHDLEQWLEGR